MSPESVTGVLSVTSEGGVEWRVTSEGGVEWRVTSEGGGGVESDVRGRGWSGE